LKVKIVLMRMDPFSYLQNRMNQLWREFDRDFSPTLQRITGIPNETNNSMIASGQQGGTQALTPISSWLPAIRLDVKETTQEVMVSADLPGVPKESIKASVDEDGLLHIRAEKREERNENEPSGQWTWKERHTGLVERIIQLPKTIDVGRAAHAEFKDGVLQMKFSKRPEKEGQAIEIQ
jgi:HSP20 family protein